MTTETRPVQIKPNIFDIFIGGARKGWNLATQNLVPNILMAYVIAYILNILGIMDFLGYWLGPIMGIFGLPGQSFVILLTTWLSCSAGVGVETICGGAILVSSFFFLSSAEMSTPARDPSR